MGLVDCTRCGERHIPDDVACIQVLARQNATLKSRLAELEAENSRLRGSLAEIDGVADYATSRSFHDSGWRLVQDEIRTALSSLGQNADTCEEVKKEDGDG